MLRTALPALMLIMFWTPGLDAQDPEDMRSVRLGTSSFIVARYSTKGGSSLYAGYGMGPAGLFVAAVINPHSGYRELMGSAFTTVSLGTRD